MLIYLEKKRERLNQWLKIKTTMDFSDWGVFLLFIIGFLAIIYFGKETKLINKISISVLWFTTIVVIQYTKETYCLKQINIKQLNYQKRPILKILTKGKWTYSFILKNIGQGAALNIELRISQIHPNGGFTNLRNLIKDEQRELFNLGTGEKQNTFSSRKIIEDYQKANKLNFFYGVKGVFAIIATYEDIDRNSYYTISLLKVRIEKNDYILKTTKISSFKNGELEKITPIDWLK